MKKCDKKYLISLSFKEYSDSEIRENFKKKLDKFVNKDKIIKELKNRRDGINKELNDIEKQLKEYNIE